MSKKVLKIIGIISKDLNNKYRLDKETQSAEYDETELADIADELERIELSGLLDAEELDILKALLVYILIRDGSHDEEDIFSFIFEGGNRILWN
ncbi:MAG: hypothetical protein AB1632_05150 [Nitrospirota bacterium]